MKEELLKGLTAEQVEKVKGCKSSKEILRVAKEEGIELNSEQLEAVSGGCNTANEKCPQCNGDARIETDGTGMYTVCICPRCGTFLI